MYVLIARAEVCAKEMRFRMDRYVCLQGHMHVDKPRALHMYEHQVDSMNKSAIAVLRSHKPTTCSCLSLHLLWFIRTPDSVPFPMSPAK